MPIRLLNEGICGSDSLNELSWFEEVLFYRLIVSCDDYGRFDGRAAYIKNRLFPLKDKLTARTVADALNKLASVGMVRLYVADGKPFLYLPNWDKFQNVRAKKSKYPDPPAETTQMQADADTCMQMYANVSVIQSNPIQSVSESNSYAEDAPKAQRTQFIPPTLDQVSAYCRERGNTIDPQHFIDHYSANGWKVGRNPMKDWKAAVRTWERNGYDRKQTGNKTADMLHESYAMMSKWAEDHEDDA